jgi:hypothetical protein
VLGERRLNGHRFCARMIFFGHHGLLTGIPLGLRLSFCHSGCHRSSELISTPRSHNFQTQKYSSAISEARRTRVGECKTPKGSSVARPTLIPTMRKWTFFGYFAKKVLEKWGITAMGYPREPRGRPPKFRIPPRKTPGLAILDPPRNGIYKSRFLGQCEFLCFCSLRKKVEAFCLAFANFSCVKMCVPNSWSFLVPNSSTRPSVRQTMYPLFLR